MGYWGWRPLVLGIFFSTWVVGCNIANDKTATSASPRTYPYVTLTVGRLPTARVSAAPTRAAPTLVLTAVASATDPAAPFALFVRPPTCYQTRPGSLLCLGRVDNPLAFPVESVVVEVRLLLPDGSLYLSARSTVEQPTISAGSFAPYHATFQADPDDFSSADAVLTDATRAVDDRYVALLIENVTGETVDGRLIVHAIIDNPGAQSVEIARAFVTLLDREGSVIGYRVVTFDAGIRLEAGARLPLAIELTPQRLDLTPEYALYVEAHAVTE